MMGALEMPKTLPEHLRPIWEEMAGQFERDIGAAGLEAVCGQVYRLREAERRITAEGLIVADVKGNPAPHPAIAIEKQAQTELRAWVAKFGKG